MGFKSPQVHKKIKDFTSQPRSGKVTQSKREEPQAGAAEKKENPLETIPEKVR
jgi:hypothetical protein